MKRFGSQLHKKAESIRLSSAERADLRARIIAYMEYHPLPKELRAPVNAPELTSEPFKAIMISRVYLSSFMGVCAMLLLVVVPVVAERAVPGDVLYPVKVQFNEELRSTLSFSPYAKVEWETKRLERRLAEARLLADEGKLTEEIEAEVAEAVQAHSDAAKQEIEVIRTSDSDEAAIAEIAFASVLEVQSEVLENRNEQANEAGRSVAGLATVVAQARSGVEASHETANPSYEKLFARIEMETTHAEELFASVQLSASAGEVSDIERRFADVNRKITEATELHTRFTSVTEAESSDEDLEQQAKQLLKTALGDTRKLISFMTDIDVRANVTIEELVPMTLTKEEQQVAFANRIAALEVVRSQIDRLAVEEQKEEKFNDGKERFVTTATAATNAFAVGDIETAEQLLVEAELMASDLLTIGTPMPVDPEEKATSTEPVENSETERSTTTIPEAAAENEI